MSPDIYSAQNSKLQRKKSAAHLQVPKHIKMVAERETNNNTLNSSNGIKKSNSVKMNAIRQQSLPKHIEEPNSYLACKGHAKSTRVRRIQGSNGFYLEVLCEGLIRGTLDAKSEYGVFHMFSVGPNKTVVRNIMTGLHLAIEDGHLMTKEIPDQSCVLDEILLDRFLVSYQSTDSRGNTHSISIEETGNVSAMPMNERGKSCTMLFKTLLLSPKDFDYYFSLANSLEYTM